jgi:hypothetical protein
MCEVVRCSNEDEAIEATVETVFDTRHYACEKPWYNFERHIFKLQKDNLDVEKATRTAMEVVKNTILLDFSIMNVPCSILIAEKYK